MNLTNVAIRNLRTRMFDKLTKITKTAFSNKFLLWTNVTLSFCLSGTGDVIEQRYEIATGEITKWNKRRTRNMAITGITVGIVSHFWYNVLDRTLPGYSLRIVAKKIFVDQVVGSPANIATFFGTLAIVEGMTFPEFVEEVKHKAWKLYAAEWIVWPTAQFINFYFLPNKYRVLYDNTVSLGYDVYTSHVANAGRNKEIDQEYS